MTTARRYLTPNAYLRNSGYHEAAWRVSPADPASVLDPRQYIEPNFLSHGRAGWNFATTAEPAARAEYAGRTLREHTGLPRAVRSAAPFPRTGDSTTQGGERSKATTAASPAGGPR